MPNVLINTTLWFITKSHEALEKQDFVHLNNCVQHFLRLNLTTNSVTINYLNFFLGPINNEFGPPIILADYEVEDVKSGKFFVVGNLNSSLTWKIHIN